MLTSDSSNDNKGVSSEGPSITSIPKEGPSIARWSKEPIPKELLEWYGYDTVEDYLPLAKKPIPKVIFKSPILIKGCTSQMEKERFDVEGDERISSFCLISCSTYLKTENRVMENQSDIQNHLVEIQAEDHDLLGNSDNKNDDMLGYESEKEYGKPDEIKLKRYFDIHLTVIKLEKSARGKTARLKNVYHHKMGRGGYVFVKEKMIKNKEIKAYEEPPRGIIWLKERVNKDGEFTDDEIRSVGDKLIKEGTLNLDDGIDAMTVVFGKENGGYARGVGSGVTYKRRKVKKLSIEMTEKDVLVKKLSNKMTETKGMRSQLMNQLAAKGVTSMGAYEVDRIRDKDARIQKKSNGLVTSKKEPVKTVGPKKTPKS
nr:hypothetical protein [Tanacetum cinerariifolium]